MESGSWIHLFFSDKTDWMQFGNLYHFEAWDLWGSVSKQLSVGTHGEVWHTTVLSLADFGTVSWPIGWSFSSKTIVLLPWWPWLSLVCEAWSPQRPSILLVSCVLLELKEQWKVLRASLPSMCKVNSNFESHTVYLSTQKISEQFENGLRTQSWESRS